MASRIILVTGSNQGIGFEMVKQLAQKGHTVYLCARNVEKGKEAVAKLHGEKLTNVHFLHLDVTIQETVDAAAKEFATKHDHLDVLVNNAAVWVEGINNSPAHPNVQSIKDTFETNFFGVLRVVGAFSELVMKSTNPVFLNITSGLGSITRQSGPEGMYHLPGYNTSKSALNMFTVALAATLKEARVNTICPGYVATNLNNYSGLLTPQESAAGVIKYGVLIEKDGPTSTYLRNDGTTFPW